MFIELIVLIVSLIAVGIGANLVINSAIKIAKSLNISEGFIGLTVLSIGTSLPEIFAHLIASIKILNGSGDVISNVVVGTNIGSNLVQITLIVGLVGLLGKVYADKKILKVDFIVMLCSIMLLFLFSINGFISRVEGSILIIIYIVYLTHLIKEEKVYEKNIFHTNYLVSSLIMCLGFVFLLFGAHFALETAVNLSDMLGWSGSFIGSIIIGVGTALPELTTALISSFKGKHSMSLGTLIGSNITNPLFALGIGAVISTYTIGKDLIFFDMPFWFFVSIFTLMFCWSKLMIRKREAIILILFYLVYVAIKIKFFI